MPTAVHAAAGRIGAVRLSLRVERHTRWSHVRSAARFGAPQRPPCAGQASTITHVTQPTLSTHPRTLPRAPDHPTAPAAGPQCQQCRAAPQRHPGARCPHRHVSWPALFVRSRRRHQFATRVPASCQHDVDICPVAPGPLWRASACEADRQRPHGGPGTPGVLQQVRCALGWRGAPAIGVRAHRVRRRRQLLRHCDPGCGCVFFVAAAAAGRVAAETSGCAPASCDVLPLAVRRAAPCGRSWWPRPPPAAQMMSARQATAPPSECILGCGTCLLAL
jgi:hypothetical protein